jgi:rare lipoprotein A (peptidoglycan hydrolase)
MSQAMGNSYCGKKVSITNEKTGKTVTAKVTDRMFFATIF